MLIYSLVIYLPNTLYLKMTGLKQIKGLDSLRAFAVIFVLISHWATRVGMDSHFWYFIQNCIVPDGVFGVYLFFVLSGFLITSILLQVRTEAGDTDRLYVIKSFFIRRVLRIFPIYYLVVFVTYFAFPEVRGGIWYLLTYTNKFYLYKMDSWVASPVVHSWTLAIEEQFYLIWPWIIMFMNKKYLRLIFILFIVTGVVSTKIILSYKISTWLPFNSYDAFGIGAWYAYARTETDSCRKFEKVIRTLGPFFLVPYFYLKVAGFYTNNWNGIYLIRFTDSMICAWLIVLVINNKSEFCRKYILENTVLNYIGKISYGIYLYHVYMYKFNPFIFDKLNKRFGTYPVIHDAIVSAAAFYIYDLIILFCLCWLSYNLIEKPYLRLKHVHKYNRVKAIAEGAVCATETPTVIG